MAPGPGTYQEFQITPVSFQTLDVWNRQIIRWSNEVQQKKKQETKKERIARLAKEKMLASWKKHNQREPERPKVIQMKQICKPQHRINFVHR